MENKRNRNMLSIFVDSFDGYSDVWDTFFLIFKHYWNDCIFPIYLVSNNLSYKDKKVKVIRTGDEIDWFTRTKRALNTIKDDYVLFMLEDYFISKKINNDDFLSIIDYMKKNDIFYYRLSTSNIISKGDTYIQSVPKNQRYAISLQPAVWKRETLLNIINSIPDAKTAWDFEVYFTKIYHSNMPYDEFIPGICYDSRDILGYKNGILQGKWIRDTIKYYKKINIKIDIGDRKKNSFINSLLYNLKANLNKKLSNKSIKNIKKILNKVGVKFFS